MKGKVEEDQEDDEDERGGVGRGMPPGQLRTRSLNSSSENKGEGRIKAPRSAILGVTADR